MRRGFSLLESVVATGILLLVACLLCNLLPSSLLAIRRAEHQVTANNLTRSLLAQTRSAGFSGLTSSTPPPVQGDDGTVYTPAITVSPVPGADPKVLLDVHVAVTWLEQQRPCHTDQEVMLNAVQF